MAKDLYGHRQMYQGPWLLLLLIPLGGILLIYLADLGFDLYNSYKVKEDTKTILNDVLTLDFIEDDQDIVEYINKKFNELGYNTDIINVEFIDGYVVIFASRTYFSVMNEIFKGSHKLAEAKYKGKYNEYKEVVIEEYTQEDEEKYFGTEDDIAEDEY